VLRVVKGKLHQRRNSYGLTGQELESEVDSGH
jgi:hypothetical protein